MNRRRQKIDMSNCADQIRLGHGRLAVLLLLSVSRPTDVLTKIALMFSIECMLDRLGDRAVLRIVDHHAGPRDRLQSDPMATNRTTNCQRNK